MNSRRKVGFHCDLVMMEVGSRGVEVGSRGMEVENLENLWLARM